MSSWEFNIQLQRISIELTIIQYSTMVWGTHCAWKSLAEGDPNLSLCEIANDSHDQPKYQIYILLLIGLFLPVKCQFSHAVIFPDVHGGYLEVTICFKSFHQEIGAF